MVQWLRGRWSPVPSLLEATKAEVDRLAAKIDATGDLLPTYGDSDDTARPHIEYDLHGYHYVVHERGQEGKRVTTTELEELLFHIFRGVTFSLALRYQSKHRIEDQDFRRLLFKYQESLLFMLSPLWAEIEAREHAWLLRQHPVDDQASSRADLTRSLWEEGFAHEIAWEKACEKYPLPK